MVVGGGRWTQVRGKYIDVPAGGARREWQRVVKLLSIPRASQISFTLAVQPF